MELSQNASAKSAVSRRAMAKSFDRQWPCRPFSVGNEAEGRGQGFFSREGISDRERRGPSRGALEPILAHILRRPRDGVRAARQRCQRLGRFRPVLGRQRPHSGRSIRRSDFWRRETPKSLSEPERKLRDRAGTHEARVLVSRSREQKSIGRIACCLVRHSALVKSVFADGERGSRECEPVRRSPSSALQRAASGRGLCSRHPGTTESVLGRCFVCALTGSTRSDPG